ncbi:MAG: pentapeptide repeat-containing protein [Alphaproteobacteria bacterium]|nr:pentapeptide repeat-containing protein [Alphaproteobacteria bacterium]
MKMSFRAMCVATALIWLSIGNTLAQSYPECANKDFWIPTDRQIEEIRNREPSPGDVLELCKASLNDRNLSGIDFTGADLRGADLTNSRLRGATFDGALLNGADLSGADLSYASLASAFLVDTKLTGTRLTGTWLTDAQFEPFDLPRMEDIAEIKGIATLWHCPDRQAALTQLRNLFNRAGLRKREREATYALNHRKTTHLIREYEPHDIFSFVYGYGPCNASLTNRSVGDRVEGYLRIALFDWTTAYGMKPFRAIGLLFLFAFGMSFIYLLPILRQQPNGRHGIFKIRPLGTVTVEANSVTILSKAQGERLTASLPAAIIYALHFSLASAFYIGWRDLNVGTWLSRLQSSDFTLRASGWVRVVSGLQSLLSVYLVAIWALTYFGRPF